MQSQAVQELIALLPPIVGCFEGTQFPLPTKTAFRANATLTVRDILNDLRGNQHGDVRNLLEPILLGAEFVEALQPDRQEYFLSDQKVQSLVFTGSKWRAGWALVLGDKHHEEHVKMLQERDFMVFTDHPGVDKTVFIGTRATSPIYFLQLMIRYGLVWGRIKPGDDHSLGHFLETDMPGFILITENLAALKYLITLGLMKLGAPAVVPPDYPFPYGNCAIASSPEEAVRCGCAFPNLRVRYEENEVIMLPSFCNPAHAREEFMPASIIGGTNLSFFYLRKTATAAREVVIDGEPAQDLGIFVEVDNPDLSWDVAATIEADALKAVDFIHGMRADMTNGILTVQLAPGIPFNPVIVAEAIRQGIRIKYPRLTKINVTFLWNREQLLEESAKVAQLRQKRSRFVAEMSEENIEQFAVCTECRPFSLEHTCILTPDKLPMCASRTYHAVKAAALFGSSVFPYKRRSEQRLPLRALFPKGAVIDRVTGEYEGGNRAYVELSGGKLKRVQLHSLRQAPHTSCGCFQNLAFWIEPVSGIGIMSRNSEAMAPDGSHWSDLANWAGGKQAPGIMGVSTSYIRAKNFLQGDGGIGNVVWMDKKLRDTLVDVIPRYGKVATEKDVGTISELRAFLGR